MIPGQLFFLKATQLSYRAARPLLFLTNSEWVHEQATKIGEVFGAHPALMGVLRAFWGVEHPALTQELHGIRFGNPVGLAAGFDYDARLTQTLRALGFGFGTVGTITNNRYEGNPPPRLGRLIASRSLVVNKGFKNEGIAHILQKIGGRAFPVPVGLSLGKTNTRAPMTQREAVEDVVTAFRAAESSPVRFAYYELNISCPNLYGNIEFYTPPHLTELLAAVTALRLKAPLFIKMPIECADAEVEAMLKVIVTFPVQGLIIGNLQKNRNDSSINQEEVEKYMKGYFSGKPTEKRSNELIRLAFRAYGKKLTIVGCGGVFSAEDAYRKIRLGASLIHLITGLIYVGPQLPAQINRGLVKLLARDGFKNLSEAVGRDA